MIISGTKLIRTLHTSQSPVSPLPEPFRAPRRDKFPHRPHYQSHEKQHKQKTAWSSKRKGIALPPQEYIGKKQQGSP